MSRKGPTHGKVSGTNIGKVIKLLKNVYGPAVWIGVGLLVTLQDSCNMYICNMFLCSVNI